MLALDWRLTIVSLLLLPVFVWISRRVGSERKKITAQRQKQMATMAATVTESLSVSGILLGRTMGRADSLTTSFAEESEKLVDLEVRSSMAGRWRMSTIGIVMAAMPALIYWAAGIALQTGAPSLSVGTLVAFVSLQQGLFRPAVSLLSTGVQIQTSSRCSPASSSTSTCRWTLPSARTLSASTAPRARSGWRTSTSSTTPRAARR